ncbi:MAG: hypothetical protein LBD08_08250, partial [Treponema sp.]|nr:hypothetical protein [Treponema sp.]
EGPFAGIFWVQPQKRNPKNDAWKFVSVLKIPLELAVKADEYVMAPQDHASVWDSLKSQGLVRGEYDQVPRGRVGRNHGVWTVLTGNYGLTADQAYAGVKNIEQYVKPNLKKMIAEAFALADPAWMYDSHYNIKGMEPPIMDDDDGFDFDEDGGEGEFTL